MVQRSPGRGSDVSSGSEGGATVSNCPLMPCGMRPASVGSPDVIPPAWLPVPLAFDVVGIDERFIAHVYKPWFLRLWTVATRGASVILDSPSNKAL